METVERFLKCPLLSQPFFMSVISLSNNGYLFSNVHGKLLAYNEIQRCNHSLTHGSGPS